MPDAAEIVANDDRTVEKLFERDRSGHASREEPEHEHRDVEEAIAVLRGGGSDPGQPEEHLGPSAGPTMGALASLEELVDLVGDDQDLYVRWSSGPEGDGSGRSKDELTGVELPGLSASALALEPWWGDRPRRLWVARRLYDYRHVAERREGVQPWVLVGRECGRGPDNEPLVECVRPVAWIGSAVVDEATNVVSSLDDRWGSLDRDRAATD